MPNDRAALVLHSIFQLGLLTFAVVLGVVCSDISAAVESIQSGNYAVVESGHTVILNWNKLTIPVLRQVWSAIEIPYASCSSANNGLCNLQNCCSVTVRQLQPSDADSVNTFAVHIVQHVRMKTC